MSRPTLAILLSIIVSTQARAHSGSTNGRPWEVCKTAALGDECEFVDHHHMVNRGTCRAAGSALQCVRHKPLVPVEAHRRSGGSSALFWAALGTGALLLVGGLAIRRFRLNPGG